MAEMTTAQRIRRSIIVYSALGLLATGIIIAVVGILPLYTSLKGLLERNLRADVRTRAGMVEQYFLRNKEITGQIAMDTRARRELRAYVEHQATLDQARNATAGLLNDVMLNLPDLAGISRYDAAGRLIAQAGLAAPEAWAPRPGRITPTTDVSVPMALDEQQHVFLMSTPIRGADGAVIGVDVAMFHLTGLRQVVNDIAALGGTGEMTLGWSSNVGLQVLISGTASGGRETRAAAAESSLGRALLETTRTGAGTLSQSLTREPEVYAYAPVRVGAMQNGHYGIVLQVSAEQLYGPVGRHILVAFGILAVLVVAGTLGMVALIHPLTGKVVIHNDELKRKIQERTTELAVELNERKKAEKAVRLQQTRMRSLYDITTMSNLGIDEQLQAALRAGANLLDLKTGLISRVNDGQSTFAGVYSADNEFHTGQSLPLAQTYCSITLEENAVVAIQRMGRSRYKDHACYRQFGQETYIGVPLWVEGRRYGTLSFSSRQARATRFSEADKDFVQLMAKWISTTLERARYQEELLRSKEAAETANRAKSQFLANMSHELRTPLNSVIGFTNILLKNKKQNLTSQDVMFLERTLTNGKHLLGLINNVLDLSKIEAGRMETELAPVALDELIREVMLQFEGHPRTRAVQLRTRLPARVAPVQTDASKLRQVLINLIGNAVKFTETGAITVRLATDPDSGRPLCIDVTDTGIGIPADKIEAIFEAFRQADNTTRRKYGGTGLGLAICRSLCQLMGYRLEAHSKLGEGSTFSILMAPPVEPRVEAGLRLTGAAAGQAQKPPAERHGDRLVLVIDDEFDSRVLLSHHVQELGYKVITADSGRQGLRMAREFQPDLITLDLLMPETDGWDVLKALKGDPELRDIPVAVVSVLAGDKRVFNFGVVDALGKPFSRDDLRDVLRRTLGAERGRALIIDDEEECRRLLAAFLDAEGIIHRDAANGREALAVLEEFIPDVIILDMVMPVMDGPAFLEALRQDGRFGDIPVVVLTGRDLSAEATDEIKGRIAAVLQKSGNFQIGLGHILDEVLAKKG